MFRKLAFSFIIILLISSTFQDSVQAQSGPATDKQVWRCLKAEQKGGKTKKPPPEVDVTISRDEGFPKDHDLYIVLVVPPRSKKGVPPDKTKTIQSTGNGDFDQELFGLSDENKNRYVDKLADLGLKFEVPKDANPNEALRSADCTLSETVHMQNANGHVNYAFYAVTINEPVTTSPTVVNEQRGNTLQYG